MVASAVPGREEGRNFTGMPLWVPAGCHGQTPTIAPHENTRLCGRHRAHSFNRRLAGVAADGPHCRYRRTTSNWRTSTFRSTTPTWKPQGTPADVLRLKELMDSHPAWIICSPEYNGSYTGLLKNTIDWASSPVKGHPVWSNGDRPPKARSWALLSASNGGLGGLRSLSHLNPLLQNLQCWVAPKQFALSHCRGALTTPAS